MQVGIMLSCIMLFLNRDEEQRRLDRLVGAGTGGLAVLYGRRRVGKTRLLVEWTRRHGGVYSVADQSTPAIQLRYLAEAMVAVFPGFAAVVYPDWSVLLRAVARAAKAESWRGPLVLDELPYLVAASPELPSLLQRWIDHEAADAGLVVAVAGSSQRMMQGLVLDANAPLFGRAREVLKIEPLDIGFLKAGLRLRDAVDMVRHHACWGGIPRYWELAGERAGTLERLVDELVLDPLGPLHREPDRLLFQEIPSAAEVRPLLDAIGAGAHRVSEIAGRLQRSATSLARPLARLVELGLARREVPFGQDPKATKRALYKIDDPFSRLWFRVVAPQRSALATANRAARLALFRRAWSGLVAADWEEVVRRRLATGPLPARLANFGPTLAVGRWWSGARPEWDVVAEDVQGRVLVGEVKWSERPFSATAVTAEARRLAQRELPDLPGRVDAAEVQRCLFVPEVAKGVRRQQGEVVVVTAAELLGV